MVFTGRRDSSPCWTPTLQDRALCTVSWAWPGGSLGWGRCFVQWGLLEVTVAGLAVGDS